MKKQKQFVTWFRGRKNESSNNDNHINENYPAWIIKGELR